MAREEANGSDDQRLARLEGAGVIRRTSRERLDEILDVPPIAPERGADILAALLEDRRTAR